jgi:hypothetical protein
MGWVLLSTLTLLGVSSCNGMGAVEYRNPIGCPLGSVRASRPKTGSTEPLGTHLGLSRPGSSQEARTRLHRASWDSSGALQTGFEPGGPNLTPQSLLGLIWGSPGRVRARRPESDSTEPPGTHLGPSRLGSGQEARIWLHKASWDSYGALQAGFEPGGPNLTPQRLLGLIWGSPGWVRVRKPESGSTEPPGIHLGPSRPGPSQEARNI